MGVDDGEIGGERALHHVVGPVEVPDLLALGDDGADAGAGEEGGNAGAAGPYAFREGTLRVELQLQLAGQVLFLEQLVLADIGRDHLRDLPGLQQDAEAGAVDAGIVGDDRQLADAGIADGVDEGLWDAAEPEASRHDGHAVEEEAVERGDGIGAKLALRHRVSLSGWEWRIGRPEGRRSGGMLRRQRQACRREPGQAQAASARSGIGRPSQSL